MNHEMVVTECILIGADWSGVRGWVKELDYANDLVLLNKTGSSEHAWLPIDKLISVKDYERLQKLEAVLEAADNLIETSKPNGIATRIVQIDSIDGLRRAVGNAKPKTVEQLQIEMNQAAEEVYEIAAHCDSSMVKVKMQREVLLRYASARTALNSAKKA